VNVIALRLIVSSWIVWSAMAAMPMQGDGAVRTIARGGQSNVDSPRQVVARTQSEWAALWKMHDYDRPAPSVDFPREMVVAVFMGSRPTAGYAVEIVSAAERNGALVVAYRERNPAPGAIAAQVLTFPFHIAALPAFAGDVKFEKVQ
jgi:protease stability complex PrcB-like protein